MREKLQQSIEKLCWLYPQLYPTIEYSELLSQEEVDLFVAFANGHVQKALIKHAADEKRLEKEVALLLNGSTGISRIHKKDVLLVESILAAASGADAGISPEMRDVVDFLRSHRDILWALHKTYEKIVKNNIIDTCPLVVAKPPFFDRIIPFGMREHHFQEFHKLLHESIHYVLEEQGIFFDNPELDEGLVTYLHKQVAGKRACKTHYTGDEGEKYLKNSLLFEKLLDKYPRSAAIPVLEGMKKENILTAQ